MLASAVTHASHSSPLTVYCRHMLVACGQECSAAPTDKGKGKGKAGTRASKRARREGSAGPSAAAGASGADEASGSGSALAGAGGSGSGEEGGQQAAEADKEMLEAEMQASLLSLRTFLVFPSISPQILQFTFSCVSTSCDSLPVLLAVL